MDETEAKKRLEDIRNSQNISVGEMAGRLGISRRAYYSLEKGPTRILNENIGRLSEITGVSEISMVFGYDPEQSETRKVREALRRVRECEERIRQLEERLSDKESVIKHMQGELESNRKILALREKQLKTAESQLKAARGGIKARKDSGSKR